MGEEAVTCVCPCDLRSMGQTKVIEGNLQRMRSREEHDSRNKENQVLTYWAMAREMGSIELHKRDQVEAAPDLDGTGIGARFAKCQFKTVSYKETFSDAKEFVEAR